MHDTYRQGPMKRATLCLSLYRILKFGGFIYFIDRTADVIRDVLVLEVEYLGILMKPELSITDTVVAAVKCTLQHRGG